VFLDLSFLKVSIIIIEIKTKFKHYTIFMFMKKMITNILNKILISLKFRKPTKNKVKRLVYNKNSKR